MFERETLRALGKLVPHDNTEQGTVLSEVRKQAVNFLKTKEPSQLVFPSWKPCRASSVLVVVGWVQAPRYTTAVRRHPTHA